MNQAWNAKIRTPDPYRFFDRKLSLPNSTERKLKQNHGGTQRNFTKPRQISKTTYSHFGVSKVVRFLKIDEWWWEVMILVFHEHVSQKPMPIQTRQNWLLGCFTEQIKVLGNRLTFLPMGPGRPARQSSPYSSPIIFPGGGGGGILIFSFSFSFRIRCYE